MNQGEERRDAHMMVRKRVSSKPPPQRAWAGQDPLYENFVDNVYRCQGRLRAHWWRKHILPFIGHLNVIRKQLQFCAQKFFVYESVSWLISRAFCLYEPPLVGTELVSSNLRYPSKRPSTQAKMFPCFSYILRTPRMRLGILHHRPAVSITFMERLSGV